MLDFTSKRCILAALICAALSYAQCSAAIEDEEFGDEMEEEVQDSEAVNAISEFLNNLDEDKAEELRKIIQETVDQPVKNDIKQYGIMFDKLQKANSKGFAQILKILAKEDELHDELESIADNCPSISTKTMVHSAVNEAKEEKSQ